MADEDLVPVAAYSQSQLKTFYSVSYKTWKSWLKPFLKEIGEQSGKCYTPKQVEIIFKHLGNPRKN